jgi:hypothetical protein
VCMCVRGRGRGREGEREEEDEEAVEATLEQHENVEEEKGDLLLQGKGQGGEIRGAEAWSAPAASVSSMHPSVTMHPSVRQACIPQCAMASGYGTERS